ncbi:MAG TPA: 23S rRNA (uracil(1939)-C(5))-methyltransferase RlmD [Solirubrobacteraceae bacterium]|jgi:23S rRNA (uracil1939-C5)-methyltransferase|nr:23S rRNA (uracil(1939)-C(5))-methyltransferase RlmD [Solirubrobacteraceae bacterium]
MDGAPTPDASSPAPASSGPASARPQRGEELELRIESLAFGGEGVARLGDGGYVVFVAGAIPGDRVRAVVHKRKRSYAHARTLEVLEPSPERIAPRARHPGVPWQVLPYERQLEIKQGQVDEALRRIGHLGGYELQEIVPALEQWRYRNKLEYSFGGGEEHGGELVCGFHASAGGRGVEQIEDCLLASEQGNRVREVALRWCREQRLSAWDRGFGVGGQDAPEVEASAAAQVGDRPVGRGRGADARDQRTAPAPDGRARLRNLVVREGRRTGCFQVRIVSTDGELDAGALAGALSAELGASLSGVLWTRSRSLAETTAGGETELVWGEAQLPERLGELDLLISPEAFFQTNTEMAEVLYELAAGCAALEGWERVYDLYCGIGTIGLTLAPKAGELWGIELVEEAVADAIATARRGGVGNAHFFAGDARLALPELLARAGRPDVLVVDPPRAGLSKKVVHRIFDASPKRIVYVSCNPTTLAPNAAELGAAGWRLRSVRPVDMFPQTHHIESVALFER